MTTLKPFGPDCNSDDLRLTFGDANPDVAHALAAAFRDVPGVEVVAGNLLDAGGDAIVSPANSFGDMGGGIDKAIDDDSGGTVQPAVIAAIDEHYLGELPVGAALVVVVPTGRWPVVVVAPTMRVPGRLGDGLNAYLALRGALVAVLRHNAGRSRPTRRLVVPGLGTGVGGMAFDEAATQMRAAYDNVIGEGWRRVVHPALAPFALRH